MSAMETHVALVSTVASAMTVALDLHATHALVLTAASETIVAQVTIAALDQTVATDLAAQLEAESVSHQL